VRIVCDHKRRDDRILGLIWPFYDHERPNGHLAAWINQLASSVIA
jgi:hypothetical protein